MSIPYAGIVFTPSNQNLIVFNQYGPFEPQWLPQVSLSSVTKLHDTASRTSLSQTFVNPSRVSPITSAKYTFPLYESCAIVSFRCNVGTRVIEGIIKEKEEARETYQAAVDQREPASLLEQHTSDVFSTSLGNIPPGATVKVEIEYIMELKHDAEIDGLRFTIPTSIAPRYGDLPSGLRTDADSVPVVVKGMNISVEVSMSSNITSVQSPSHPISVHLGGHSEDTPDHAFNPHHALATLGQTSTELGKDFILLIKSVNLSSPSALLETHLTIPNSKALMLTLVPKFNLPESSKPEVVFIVDRSGSMVPRVAPLKSSLSVFLKSLPLGINFNICSFGSTHSFLWDRSQPYTHQSFAEAQRHCDSMQADFGGTEILPPIQSTIAKRYQDLNLEIMVLTDGQVWNSDALFEYVEKETAKGDVRVFSLGIGQDVSHSLIDGLARVGRGFSQVVSDEREGMESKVARMLRGALSAHILDYRLEWEGKPSEENTTGDRRSSIRRQVRRISLFNTNVNPDPPISFSNPADFVAPSVLQAPYKLQPLFPFSRSTAYIIFSSSDARPPSHVWLRGTTPAGDELELEIEVKHVPGRHETIHQLAARKILQELKDGTGYLHSGRYGVSRERQPGAFAELVKSEGVRVGLKYGVASHWTSFVAVVRRDEGESRVDGGSLSGLDDDDNEEYEFVDGDGGGDDDDDEAGAGGGSAFGGSAASGFGSGSPTVYPSPPQRPGSMPVMMMMAPPPPPIEYPTKSSKLFPDSTKRKSASYKSADSKWSAHSEPSLDFKSSGDGSPTAYSRPFSRRPSKKYSALQGAPPTATSPSSVGSAMTGKREALDSPFDSRLGSFLGKSYDTDDDDKSKDGFTALSKLPSSGQTTPPPAIPYPTKSSFSSNLFSGSPKSKSASYKGADSRWSAYSEPSPDFKSPRERSPTTYSRPFFSRRTSSKYSARQGAPQTATSPSSFSSAVMSEGEALDNPFDSLDLAPSSFLGKSYDTHDDDKSKARFTTSSKLPSSRPTLSKPKWLSKSSKSDTSDIAIVYSPPSGPPAERLSSETGTQPLSLRTKALIGLQTSDGCFVLNPVLATFLGFSITVLEAKLESFVPSNVSLSQEQKEKVWATMLAIKLFETQLAGERSVWQLVVDKAKAWIRYSAIVSDTDLKELEKLVGEVLGA